MIDTQTCIARMPYQTFLPCSQLFLDRINNLPLNVCRFVASATQATIEMALAAQLTAQYNEFTSSAPPAIKDPIVTAKANFNASFDQSRVIKVKENLPQFSLPDATGKIVSSESLLAQSPLLITFYRGEWCPFCNLALIELQKHVPEYQARGVEFVAISPELPNTSLTTIQKHNLSFPVLSDLGNAYARQLGIVFKQDEKLKDPFGKIGIDLQQRNGDGSFEVPVPITLLVGRDGAVKNIFVDPDFTKRLEPTTALEWIDELNGES